MEGKKKQKVTMLKFVVVWLFAVLWCCSSGPSELDTNSREGS